MGPWLRELAPAATGGQDARTLKLSPDIMGNTVYCRLSEQKKWARVHAIYRVFHLLMGIARLGWVDFDLGALPSYPAA